MKRNKHSLSHYRLLTLNMGRLVPVGCFEVLPGDTVQQATSALIRVTPLMAPVMHPVSVRIHHWFVPYRLLWEGWEDFITGGRDGMGDGTGTLPTYNVGPTGAFTGSLPDYLGVPVGVPNLEFSQFPINGYLKIWNEFYRDQDLQDEIDWEDGNEENWDYRPLPIAWEKDYFTSSRPWPQKGPDVSMPLAGTAPVRGYPDNDPTPIFAAKDGRGPNGLSALADGAVATTSGTGTSYLEWSDPRLVADLSAATAVNVNDVRRAFALQRYQEARARYGSRYTEYLRYLGVRSSDARLQRPEYLGGGKQTISFSEVLQTGPGSTEGSPVPGGVGQMAGHGISAMRSRRYRRFFEEHGLVMSLMSVRPRSIYTNGLPRWFSRKTKEDFWQKELEQIGQQEVFRREVYAQDDAAGGSTVWGYQDRYAEYKHIPSTVHGEFRNLMNYWHYGRDFASAPALNKSFIECDPTKRVYAEQTQDCLWVMVNNNIQARRMVSRGSSSRIL